jgi:hypothetical protein
MSLNWNAQSVKNIDEMLEKDEGNLIGQFAFVLMAIQMSSVSEKNVGEVWARIQIWEALNGPLFYTKEDKPALTWEFVSSLVGYGTNVSTTTLSKWSASLIKREAERYQIKYQNLSKEPANA